GKPVLRRTVEALRADSRITHIMCVIHADDHVLYEDCMGEDFSLIHYPVTGGTTRQASVLAGLEALAAFNPQHVLIHDGARPFLGSPLLDRIVEGLHTHSAILPALQVVDTLQRVDGDQLCQTTVPRDGLWRAQTPQAFQFENILNAHRTVEGQDLTDDVAVARAAGMKVTVVDGSESNFKLTTEADFIRGEVMLSTLMETRTGSGFDVHQFVPGTHVTLCGIEIPHTHRLSGHSDADVAMHALTDALLGAIGDGDIGAHFPPTDPQWKGAASHIFLEHARDLINKRMGRIVHVDVTIICEAPKVGPHRDAMRANLARLLSLDLDRVSVKATTTEQLGFTGRKEGIAAQAIASVELPTTARGLS
ncbi:MAG: bifunctional 2-C-methyl-D-erythritol 4-phosphate cytidylyltransferase/2-C-methyl-D-erythritol 2,4-cyclodiphosphate synthase, partial [Parvibaculaceae bacterium]|nr:bifunctional 2-C-methyl-D-erythritol 4-phosphate cytidylyltransferase/2-C-methyl-D-erythritol 2,4-cyclodiphosphate synthase [Parvibaculaceae bacterium]